MKYRLFAFAAAVLTAISAMPYISAVAEETATNGAFSNCTNLQTVMLPKYLTSLGSSAFAGCAKLESIDLPAKLRRLGEGAFLNCKALRRLQCRRS